MPVAYLSAEPPEDAASAAGAGASDSCKKRKFDDAARDGGVIQSLALSNGDLPPPSQRSCGDDRTDEPVSAAKRRNFTPEEDTTLELGVAKWGCAWEEIRIWGNFARSAESLAKRYLRLTRAQQTPPPEAARASPGLADRIVAAGGMAGAVAEIPSGSDLGQPGLFSPPLGSAPAIAGSPSRGDVQTGGDDTTARSQPPPHTPSSKKIHDYFPRAGLAPTAHPTPAAGARLAGAELLWSPTGRASERGGGDRDEALISPKSSLCGLSSGPRVHSAQSSPSCLRTRRGGGSRLQSPIQPHQRMDSAPAEALFPTLSSTGPSASPGRSQPAENASVNVFGAPRSSAGLEEAGRTTKSADAAAAAAKRHGRQLAELAEKLAQLEKRNLQLEQQSRNHANEVDLLQQRERTLVERFERLHRVSEQFRARARTHLVKLLAQQARVRAHERRRELARESLRLGTLAVESSGLSCSETWQEGTLVHELNARQRRIGEEREEVERKRKVLSKRKAQTAKATAAAAAAAAAAAVAAAAAAASLHAPASDVDAAVAAPVALESFGRSNATTGDAGTADARPNTPGTAGAALEGSSGAETPAVELITPLEAHELDETYRNRLATLRRDETEINNELSSLASAQQRHVRLLRLVREEDASRFNGMLSGNPTVLKERYVMVEMLGKGGFSEVWKAFDLEQMQWVACKVHTLLDSWSEARRQAFVKHVHREFRIHQSVNHPRIVRCLDVIEHDRRTCITVLEYCNAGDLEGHLQQSKTLPEREAKCILLQVLSGLRYLNEGLQAPVIHFDLKPGNILFHHGEAKITDFGLSKIVAHDDDALQHLGSGAAAPAPRDIQLTSHGAGTYWYLPPECFDNREGAPLISSKVDVWSLGVIYYEMLFGQKPFGNDKSQQSILNESTIMNDAHVLVFPSKPPVSQESKEFIRRCLEYQKALRPDVSTLCRDAFVNPPLFPGRKAG